MELVADHIAVRSFAHRGKRGTEGKTGLASCCCVCPLEVIMASIFCIFSDTDTHAFSPLILSTCLGDVFQIGQAFGVAIGCYILSAMLVGVLILVI